MNEADILTEPVVRQIKAPQSDGRCLVALNERDFNAFFEGSLADELKRSVKHLQHIDDEPDPTGLKLKQQIDTFNPDILITGWSTPMLPVGIFSPEGPIKYVCNVTGSVRNWVSREHIEHGLTVTNWGTSISRTVAECALMQILMCLRCTAEYHEFLHHNNGWTTLPSRSRQLSLFGRRVGIHGFGKVARELVTLLRPFKVDISSYCPTLPDSIFEEHEVTRSPSLEDLFSTNQVIVELEGLTERTYHCVNEEILRLIPDEGVLVNVGRGAVIDQDALVKVLADSNLRVGLDVFEEEPLPADSPLRLNPNIVITPHIAGPTADRLKDAGSNAVSNIRNYLTGQPLNGLISPELYPYMT